MTFKLFTEIYDTMKKVLGDIKSVTEIPKKERSRYRDVLGETYLLLDTTLNMVISRLNDILLMESIQDQLDDIEKLSYWDDWYKAERNFRLCSNLRATLREMNTLIDKLTGKVSTKNWDDLKNMMALILATEGKLAEFIGHHFLLVSDKVSKAISSKEKNDLIIDIKMIRDQLAIERRTLIKQEMELYDIVI